MSEKIVGETAITTLVSDIKSAISEIPRDRTFKGTLGVGGTIQSLPVNGSANIGDTYRVITNGTYAGKAAVIGDEFSCNGKTSSSNTWAYIPQGDNGYIELVGTLSAGQTSLVLSDASITTTSTIDIYTDTFGIQPVNAVVATGTITLTFLAQASNISVKVRVS